MIISQHYWRISPERLADLKRSPEKIDAFLLAAFEDELDEESEPVAWVAGPPVDAESLDLAGAWQAVHFLLTGEPEGGPLPLRNAVMGGTPLEGVEAGPEGPRVLSPEEVREVAEALNRIPEDDLRALFDPLAFKEAGIAHFTATLAWGSEDLDPLLEAFDRLARFFREAAQRGEALLLARALT